MIFSSFWFAVLFQSASGDEVCFGIRALGVLDELWRSFWIQIPLKVILYESLEGSLTQRPHPHLPYQAWDEWGIVFWVFFGLQVWNSLREYTQRNTHSLRMFDEL